MGEIVYHGPITEPIMTYEPTNWKSGDVITSKKLNKLEKQLSPLIIDITDNSSLGMSYKDIKDAILSGRKVTAYSKENNQLSLYNMHWVYKSGDNYVVGLAGIYDYQNQLLYIASSEADILMSSEER